MLLSNKPFKTLDEQVQLLEDRGLIISDKDFAKKKLELVGYHYLSSYMKSFQSAIDVFDTGTTFEDIHNLYLFDKELKQIIFPVLNELELAIKNKFAYYIGSIKGNNIEYIEKDIYDIKSYEKKLEKDKIKQFYMIDDSTFIQKINKIILKHRNNNIIKDFYIKYDDLYIPQWKLFEIIDMGDFNKIYKDNVKGDEKDKFLNIHIHDNYYNFHQLPFDNILEILRLSRNQIAHCGRFWNSKFYIELNNSLFTDISNQWKIFDPSSTFVFKKNHINIYIVAIAILHKILFDDREYIDNLLFLTDKYKYLKPLPELTKVINFTKYIYDLPKLV